MPSAPSGITPAAGRARTRPEVLAPAGDAASMRAAIRAGADAVYFGLDAWSARARAENFDEANLEAVMRTLHENGTRGYVALNTLVFDAELARLEASVRACAAAGVDAVIVQDLGVAALVRAIAPTLAIHASTQMTCTDAASVELARSLGARRVILARELSLEDIRAIRSETDLELEVFVHGALCIAYSGQCLTSEAIGGRSANRGACAQACRLPYELLVDGIVKDLGERAYLLSPEDLEATRAVPELLALGIASLKIEGRLKGPDYVAATTALYRKAVDAALGEAAAPTPSERRAALQTYSRGSGVGFFEGVDHQRLVEGRTCAHRGIDVGVLVPRSERVAPKGGAPRLETRVRVRLTEALQRGDGLLIEGGFAGKGAVGGRVWSITREGAEVAAAAAGDEATLWFGPEVAAFEVVAGRRVFRTDDPGGEREVKATLDRRPYRIPLDLEVCGEMGGVPVFRARADRGAEVEVLGDSPLTPAKTSPLDEQALRDKLGRLGETPFALRDLRVTLPAGATVAISSLNRARRALVDALLGSLAGRPHPTTDASYIDRIARPLPPPPRSAAPALLVLCRNLEQAEAAFFAGADGIYLDILELTGTGPTLRRLRELAAAEGHTVTLGVTPPRVRRPGEEKIDRYLDTLGADALLVRGLGALHEPPQTAAARIGDFSLNVTNGLAAREVLARGLAAFTPSFDLDATQLLALLRFELAPFAEVVVHHPMPLFHMEHCVFAALLSEGKDHLTCGRPCERHAVSLRDRAGMDHPVIADVGCRNTVFHSASQSAATLVPSLLKQGVRRFRVELVREGAPEVRALVTAYRSLLQGSAPADAVWRKLRSTEGYGVVRGSLRVLGAA